MNISAPPIVLQPGDGLWFASISKIPTTRFNMTNLNQLDADLKALKAEVIALTKGMALVANDITAIRLRLDDLVGGPADDDQQEKLDELESKANAAADALSDAVSSVTNDKDAK